MTTSQMLSQLSIDELRERIIRLSMQAIHTNSEADREAARTYQREWSRRYSPKMDRLYYRAGYRMPDAGTIDAIREFDELAQADIEAVYRRASTPGYAFVEARTGVHAYELIDRRFYTGVEWTTEQPEVQS
jgi:hypothetical protein